MIFNSELDIRKTGHDQLLHVQSPPVLAIASVDTLIHYHHVNYRLTLTKPIFGPAEAT